MEARVQEEGRECVKVLTRINEDLMLLNGKVTRRKTELTVLEKKVQKQNKKLLKLPEWLEAILDHVGDLEEVEEWDKRIWALERKVVRNLFVSIYFLLTSNSFFPRTLILLTHVLTFAMISPHVLFPLFHFTFTIHTETKPSRTLVKSIQAID